MSTQIAKQISARMKAKNLSVMTLEKMAGLKTHAVRNIIRGNSKKPSAEILQAVSDVLGCTVKDLLTKQEIFQEDELIASKEGIMNTTCDSLDLLQATVKFVEEKLIQKNKNQKMKPTVRQSLICVEEIYLHSLGRDPSKVDEEFGEWFINLTVE